MQSLKANFRDRAVLSNMATISRVWLLKLKLKLIKMCCRNNIKCSLATCGIVPASEPFSSLNWHRALSFFSKHHSSAFSVCVGRSHKYSQGLDWTLWRAQVAVSSGFPLPASKPKRFSGPFYRDSGVFLPTLTWPSLGFIPHTGWLPAGTISSMSQDCVYTDST